MDWRKKLPAKIVTATDLMDALDDIRAEAASHGLVPSLIRDCMRAKATDE